VALLGAAGVVLVGLGGCVAPAPTISAYQGKAVRTAQDALSQVETARLAVSASGQGRLPQAYLETVLTAAEDAYSSVQATFDSVQPPEAAAADQLRDSLDTLLTQGSDALAELRILARRRRSAELAAPARSLAAVAAGLARFRAEHSA
jgi:uncharacterized membrane protein YdfJ with MMPL/SSD domain